MQRLRYFNQIDGTKATKPLQGSHDMLVAKTQGLHWQVWSSTGSVLAEGEAKNDTQLKKAVKAALKEQGVLFFDEARNKALDPQAV